MERLVRSLVVLPLLAMLLVGAPAILLSFALGSSHALAQTVPEPTPTPVVTPTPRATATPADLRVRAAGALLAEVIGNRLSDTIYGYAVDGRLMRSDNNGVSWRLVTARPQVDAFLMSAADPDLLYAGGPLACFDESGEPARAPLPFQRSVDGGATFTETVSLTSTAAAGEATLQPLILHPTEPETVIAAGCSGLYASFDGGAAWRALSRTGVDGIPGDFVVQEIVSAYAAVDPERATLDILYAVASDAEGRSLVLASDDEGRTWAVITPDASDITFRISSLTADPDTEGRLWFAASSGVWSTADMGLFWGLTSRGLPSGDVLNDIVYHPRRILLVATDAGLYARGTPINLWSPVGDEALQSLAIDSLLFTEGRPNRIWLNAGDGVYFYTLQ